MSDISNKVSLRGNLILKYAMIPSRDYHNYHDL